jgi:hypothetical protein
MMSRVVHPNAVARPEIQHGCQVQRTFLCRDARNVGDLNAVEPDPVYVELAYEPIRRDRIVMVQVSRGDVIWLARPSYQRFLVDEPRDSLCAG